MRDAATWSVRNVSKATRERAIIMAAISDIPLCDLVERAMKEYYVNHKDEWKAFYRSNWIPDE